jgi:hypothetical protein
MIPHFCWRTRLFEYRNLGLGTQIGSTYNEPPNATLINLGWLSEPVAVSLLLITLGSKPDISQNNSQAT